MKKDFRPVFIRHRWTAPRNPVPLNVCHHEAGHAIASIFFGYRFEAVMVWSAADEMEHFGEELPNPAEWEWIRRATPSDWPESWSASNGELIAGEYGALISGITQPQIVANLVCMLAGPFAESRFSKVGINRVIGPPTPPNADGWLALAFARAAIPGLRERGAALEAAMLAARLLFRNRQVWTATRAVADALMDRGELTYAETAAIVGPLEAHEVSELLKVTPPTAA